MYTPSELLTEDSPQSYTEPLSPMSPLTTVTAQMAKLWLQSLNLVNEPLEDEGAMPGSFLFNEAAPSDSSPSMDALETLLTAAVLTDGPTDESHHHRLFSSAAECYEDSGPNFPSSPQPLDVTTALQSLAALTKTPSVSPARQAGGRRFTSKAIVSPSKPSLPPSSPSSGKIEKEESCALDHLSTEFKAYQTELLDGHFAALSTELQCQKLDRISKWLNDGLVAIENYEERMKYRKSKAKQATTKEDIVQEKRDCIRDLYDTAFIQMDPLNQILILLAVICNLIIGLSVDQSNFLIHATILCIHLGMSTCGSPASTLKDQLSSSQNKIIADMPKNLTDALRRFDVDGRFDFYVICPSCSFSNKAHPLKGKKTFYDFPPTCHNNVVGEKGVSRCGTNLLKTRCDGSIQPIKPYLVSSLSDYLARCLANATFVEQSKQATDSAFRAIVSGKVNSTTDNVFDAAFIKDFKGPDRTLFVNRGNKIRLVFSMHVDFFNPNRVTQRGAHDSIGVISCANLALDLSIRYRPEFMYMTVIPGPNEPSYDELDHYIWPVIEQFILTWRPGLKISRTANSRNGSVVEAGILISVNDLPAARKVAGLQGHGSSLICSVCDIYGKDRILSMDYDHWTRRNVDELRKWAWAYKNATTLAERQLIFDTHSVRWSSFWLLEYWDPTRMLVIDAMHCILEGLVHYHSRHVLRLDASAAKLTSDGLKIAFDWPWIPYSPEAVSPNSLLQEKHIPAVAKIQETLCLSLSGKNALSMDKLWTRLNNQSTKGALEFVARSLEVPEKMENVDNAICSLYIDRAKTKSKRKAKDQLAFPYDQPATTKHHLIALLLNWRLKQPHCSDAYIIPTGTPETLAHVQKVIQETIKPAYINSVPRNFGEAKAGSLKADEWRTLSTLYLPIALITLWGDNGGLPSLADESEAGHLLKALHHTMALFQATIIACRYVMTEDRARAYWEYMKIWTGGLQVLFPHVQGGVPRPNIHAAAYL
ncbi:hypothetical protein D9757_005190 [Collybiopsis confluens]|uniref:Uncharacterized protein n=1 Tax=Collybiopsis confluens TaxID=2823264 RepID=A0A8H5HW47_9AGAR|nr:hypothetical protein D9757_005190 [Collybiopsis confluens]